jgi:uncharacterized coiled-coil protein SlyX
MAQSKIEERLEKLEIQSAVTNTKVTVVQETVDELKDMIGEVKVALTNHLMHFSGPQWIMLGAQLLTILGVVIGLVEVVIRR